MIRSIAIMLLLPIAPVAFAQVDLDTRLEFTGGEGGRGASIAAEPTSPTSAITVEGSVSGIVHWAEATLTDQTIALSQPVGASAYRPGMFLRFLCPEDLHGPLWLELGDLPPLPLLRSDGLHAVRGQLRTGRVIEIVHAVDHWVLIAPEGKGCPQGALPVHDGLCIDVQSQLPMGVYDAIDHCHAQGGKLCTWDELYLACTVLEGQLQNMHAQWEWLDETSNHTHTANQGVRYTCMSQRSANPVLNTGRVRCCYHTR